MKFMDIRDMAKWYMDNQKIHHHPSEFEVSNHLVTPLLKILGWDAKHISYERYVPSTPSGRLDIALHRTDCRKWDEDVLAFIEVKKFGKLNEAADQAMSYLPHFPNAKKFILTDGYTYKIFDNASPFRSGFYLDLIEASEDTFKKHLFSDVVHNA